MLILCDVHTTGHIARGEGETFASFKHIERVRLIRIGFVPANAVTHCAHRRGGQCNTNCRRAHSAIRAGGKISRVQKGKRM